MAAEAELWRREGGAAATELLVVEAAFEAHVGLVGGEAEGRGAVARALWRLLAQEGLGRVLAGGIPTAARGFGGAGGLGRRYRVGARFGEDDFEVGGAVVMVVFGIEGGWATAGDRAAQGHPIGNAAAGRRHPG